MPKSEDVPACPSIPAVRSTGREAREYSIELVTPLFGGGVSTRVNDPSFPIRPTSIRGQLQFWWRATVGSQYATRQELRTAQSAVWGDTTQASRVDVLVDGVQVSRPTPCARYERDHQQPGKYRSMPSWNPPFQNTSLPYALFPFQGQLANGRAAVEVEPAACIQQASFRLMIRCPKDFWPQVEPAVWAWVNFGGLGGRTRRGCGAILCRKMAPKDRNDLIRLCKPFVRDAAPRDWPTLAAAILVGGEQPNAIAAWDHVIERFRYFRQGERLGRNPGQQQSRPGRSRFPEPESIRRTTGRRSNQHGRLSRIPDDGFPRAELGLPIVFHFKDDRVGDPPDTVLYPSNDPDGNQRERMASPLILRPLALANGKAVPLILRLKTPALTGVDLRHGDVSLNLPPTTVIRDPRLSRYQDSPLAGSPSGSAIEAFLAHAKSKGFTEVTP